MTLSIENKTSTDLTHVENLIKEFYPYAQQRLGFNKPVSASLISDPDNASDLLGKTAYYSPQAMQIAVYIDGRHPKDILRSFSHELVHHAQNCRGEFDRDMNYGEGYAQKDEHLRLMEKEAYLEGQMILRDWENTNNITKESKQMTEEKLRGAIRTAIQKVLNEGETLEEKHDCADHPGMSHKQWQKSQKKETIEEKKKKKPDGDGDGVPPWADKDDNNPKVQEEITEEEVNEEEIVEEMFDTMDAPANRDEEVVEEDEEVNEEETLQEWKERTMYQTLMEKWCK
jgi:hypothetical protein